MNKGTEYAIGAGGCLLMILLAIGGCIFCARADKVPPPGIPKATGKAAEYTVLKEEFHDAPVKTMVSYRILIKAGTPRKEIQNAMLNLWYKAKAKPSKYRAAPNQIFVFVYTRKPETGAEWVARLTTRDGGAPQFDYRKTAGR